jgi:hypothetical protein
LYEPPSAWISTDPSDFTINSLGAIGRWAVSRPE